MEENMYTREEIENFIDVYFSQLNLTNKEKERYIKFIKKRQKRNNTTDSLEYIEKKIEDLKCFFIDRGFTKEESLIFTSKVVLFCDRKELVPTLNFLITTNLIRDALLKGYLFHFNLNKFHAKKAYLTSIGNKNNNAKTILSTSIKEFTENFNIEYDILIKYPITDELKQVWNYQARLNNEEIKKEFHLTRDEISIIYPTSIDELMTLKTIGTMNDEEIIKRYGITRQELLQKHPLNNDTLKAIKSINMASDNAVRSIFNTTKNEVLKLRTITTEMIKTANKNIKLKRKNYNNEISETIKSKKKGTYPNG